MSDFPVLFIPTTILPDTDPMVVTVDAAQWARDRIRDGQRRLLVVFRDWGPPGPNAHHPDEERLHAELLPVESNCVHGRTAAQAAAWAGLRDEGIEAALITRDVPLTASWRVGLVAAEKGCLVWRQAAAKPHDAKTNEHQRQIAELRKVVKAWEEEAAMYRRTSKEVEGHNGDAAQYRRERAHELEQRAVAIRAIIGTEES